MNVKSLLLRQLRTQAFNKTINARNLNTQTLSTVKGVYLRQSRCLLADKSDLFSQQIRTSKSYLPTRKRGFVMQGRKEELDYDRSGLLLAFYYNAFLVGVTFIYYWKKGLFM